MINIVFIVWAVLCPGPTVTSNINNQAGVVVTLDEDDGDETGHIPPTPPIPPIPPRP